jgi:Mrp family chromosome partitioning ATPase
MPDSRRTDTGHPVSDETISDGTVQAVMPTSDSRENISRRTTAGMGSQSGSTSQTIQISGNAPNSGKVVRVSSTPATPGTRQGGSSTPSGGMGTNTILLVPAAPFPSGTDGAPGRSATPPRIFPDSTRGATAPVWTVSGMSSPVRTSTPASPTVVRSSQSAGPGQPGSGPFEPVNPNAPIPAVYPDAVAPSPSVRTVIGAPSAIPAGEASGAASVRRNTPEMGVMLQGAAAFASYSQPTTPAGGASERTETTAQKPSSALLVRLAAPAAPVPTRLTARAELLRRGIGETSSDLIPAQIRSAKFEQPGDPDPHLPLLQKEGDTRSASFRALRRRLTEQGNPAVILVTSAEEEEGKSTCAANLALAMAESGRLRVLLVEANLHQPSLAQIFGFQPSPCLLEQLATHRKEPDAPWFTTEIQPVGLHVLAVAPGADRNQSIHGPSFLAAVSRWRLAFDHVVIDGPAILSSSDTAIIQDSVDTVLMVARSGVSRNRAVKRALDQISSDMVAGLVLMDSRWAR